MKRRLSRVTAIMLALAMVFAQMSVVSANSMEGSVPTRLVSENEIRSRIREGMERGLEQNADDQPGKQAAEKRQVLQSDSDLKDKENQEIVPDQFIVKYKAGTSNMTKSALNAKVSAVSSKSFDKLGFSQIRLTKGADVKSAMDKLKDDPSVEYVEPVYVRNAFGVSDVVKESVVDSVYSSDPFYKKGWQWGLEAINVEEMWEAVPAEGRSQVTIAVIDSGVDADHDEFAGNIVEGYDFVNNDSIADDDNGHGTHVAGIAAAAHDNVGMEGVAGGAKLMPIKVLDENGRGDTVKLINGILFAVNNGADVINLSLGGRRSSIAEEEAILYALQRGVTIVAAAGNEHSTRVNYPAAYDGVIAVGAVDWDGESGKFIVADFSNIGPELDLLAPGVDILSTVPQELDNLGNKIFNGMGDAKQDGYTVADGTSMAAPFVTGVAALVLAEKPDLECPEVLTELQANSLDFVISYYDGDINVPVLNGGSAINSPFSYRHAILSKVSGPGSAGAYEFNLSFADYKGTVTDAVYSKFDLMMGEYTYLDGFKWITEPDIVDEIDVVDGTGTISVGTGINKNYVFYVEGTDSYIGSNPVLVSWDESEDFDEAVVLDLGVETGSSIGTVNDEDFYTFEITEEDYYVIESTGDIDLIGTLYNEEYGDYEEIAWDDDNGTGMNFKINTDNDGNALILTPGTYYVSVEGYKTGDYGIIIRKQKTISGTVSLPIGITAEGYLYLEISLIQRKWDAEEGKYYYYYEEFDSVEIPFEQSNTTYKIISDTDSDYIVEYYICEGSSDYAYTGYYSGGGTVALSNTATPVAAGAENINMTLIPTSTIEDDERNTFETAAPILLGTMENGTMHYDGDVDLYKLSVTAEGSYIIGTEIDSSSKANMYYGAMYDHLGNYVNSVGNGSSIHGERSLKYRTYNLTSGTYYYAAYGYNYPFNTFEYSVIAKEASVISGTVSLPEGITAPGYSYIWIIAEDSQGVMYTCQDRLRMGDNNFEYALGVPLSGNYVVSYFIDEYDEDLLMYAKEGYYSTNGTKTDKASATPVNASSNISGINLKLISLTDTEGDSKETAKQISSGILVGGRINTVDDVDYYKFTVPQGGGYYNIDTQSEEYISIYFYNNEDWILYDEGYESYLEGFLSEGVYYLMVRADDNYYGDYSFIVRGIHKPMATNVSISGTPRVDSTLTGRYTYFDGDKDVESGTTYRWLRSGTPSGTYTEITGATAKTYKLTQSDLGKYIKFEVTPKTNNEPATGAAVTSNAAGPVLTASTGTGGTGGGGGGGGGTSTYNNTTYEQTIAGTATVKKQADGKTTVEVKVDSSKLNSALTAPGSAPVTIDVNTKASQDKLGVNIPSGVFSQAAAAQKPVVVNSNNADFTFQPGTFDSNSLSGDVKLEVSQLTTDSIPDSMKNKDAANNEVSLVFDFDLSIGGNKVTDFNKPVSITIKIDPSKVADMSKVGVYYYNEKDGIWEYVGGTVNQDGTVTFTVDHFSMYMAIEYKKIFDDIANHWAKADIELLLAKHIARSESEKSFAPNSSITRAAFASMVVKALDIKGVSTDKVFTDIPSNSWYKEDVYKAYAAGVIDGVSSSEFAPGQLITREQMATMLMRAYEYATGKKLDEIVTTANVRFNDESSISSWAKRNVVLANATGLVAGNPDGTYNPKGNTTKAQAAVVIKRLMEKLNRL